MLTTAILWQASTANDHNLLLILIAIVSITVVVQAIVLVSLALGVKKTQSQVLLITQELQAKAGPVLDAAARILEETSPKIRRVSDNLVDTTDILRDKAVEIDLLVSETVAKARAQVNRMDDSVTGTLNTVGRVTAEVQHAIMVPVRHISGVLHGFKAGLETLSQRFQGWKKYAAPADLADDLTEN